MIDGINLQFSLYLILIILFITSKNPNFIYFLILIPLLFFSFLNSRSKIFIGDSGTYSISFLLSYFFIKLFNSNLLNEAEIILILLIPGAELIRVFLIRIINKTSPFRGDRNHLHHYLLLKTNNTKSLIIFISLCSLPSILNHFFEKVLAFGLPLLLYLLVVYYFKKA
jgi:UDP-GlcNAc:undecaprenyl-phosphate GlcNAc-1-phosphate transferase